MGRELLANQLIASTSSRERRRLLRSRPSIADIQLARQIKDVCYSRWASEPIVARKAAAALSVLASYQPSIEVKAIASWIDGIAKISQGKFQQAIEGLDAAAESFRDIGKETDAAQTHVAKLIALALLGRYDEADETGREALKMFEKAGDQLAAGKIELNLSNVALRREKYTNAELYGLSALDRFTNIKETSWQAMAENDLGNTYSHINEFRKAEKYFTLAAHRAEAANMTLTQAEIEASLGNLEMFRGRYSEALRYLELSRQKYDELGLPHQSAIADLEIAEVYCELNLELEAASILRSLVKRLNKLKLKADEARARTLYARLLAHNGEFVSAIKELNRASQIYDKEDNLVGKARTNLLRCELMLQTEEFSKAEITAVQARDQLKRLGNKRLTISAEWFRAEAKRLRGNIGGSRRLMSSVVRNAQSADVPRIAVAGLTSLGKLEMSAGNVVAAKYAFRQAVKIIERMRVPIASDEIKMSFLAALLEPYNQLFQIAAENGRTKEAFILHESARARTLVESMGSNMISTSPDKISRKLDDIREELNWYYSRLSHTDTGSVSELEVEIALRERELTKLTRQQDSLASKKLHRSQRFDLSTLQSSLKRDASLIEYVIVEDSISAFVITREAIRFIDRFSTESEIKQMLAQLRLQFGTLRFGAQAIKRFLPQLKRNTEEFLNSLYEALISPVAGLTEGKRLIIAPTGALNHVPFNALFDGQKYLLERYEVSLTPSAEVWMSTNRRNDQPMINNLLIGHSDGDIPLAEAEIRAVKNEIKGNTIALTGNQATFNEFAAKAPTADIIHFACHGQFRSDNPNFSSLHLANGLVTVRDIAQQKLRAKLVTLSACETGLGDIRAGDEFLGLTRSFLVAGAQNLIVSLWSVNDASTSELMLQLYRHLQRGCSPSASLRAAQQDFVSRGVHPYYWSPFVVIGQ